MDRRDFCKHLLMAVGFVGLSQFKGLAAMATHPRSAAPDASGRKYRVRVLRRLCFEDLQSVYLGNPECGRCDQVCNNTSHIISEGHACPDKFCPLAWEAIQSRLRHGACVRSARGCNSFIVSCPDGTRPVIFSVEQA